VAPSAWQLAGELLAVCEPDVVALPVALPEALAEADAEPVELRDCEPVAVSDLVCGGEPLPLDEALAVMELDAPGDRLREGTLVGLPVSRLEAVMLTDLEPELELEPLSDLLLDAERVRLDGELGRGSEWVGECEMLPEDDEAGAGEELVDTDGELEADAAGRRELGTARDAAAEEDGEPDDVVDASVQLQLSCPTSGGQQPLLKRVELALKTGDCTMKSSLVWLHGVAGKTRNLRPYWKWKRLIALERLSPVWKPPRYECPSYTCWLPSPPATGTVSHPPWSHVPSEKFLLT